uniref:Transmembrane protein n=1 Tax=Heterorhabditis bacteriophora TaxID=37862 RepID=A0A1I7WLV8_HETBA
MLEFLVSSQPLHQVHILPVCRYTSISFFRCELLDQIVLLLLQQTNLLHSFDAYDFGLSETFKSSIDDIVICVVQVYFNSDVSGRWRGFSGQYTKYDGKNTNSHKIRFIYASCRKIVIFNRSINKLCPRQKQLNNELRIQIHYLVIEQYRYIDVFFITHIIIIRYTLNVSSQPDHLVTNNTILSIHLLKYSLNRKMINCATAFCGCCYFLSILFFLSLIYI